MKCCTELFEKQNKDKQKRIIEAAILEFSEKGFENANTNKIARNANISVGSLFKYFENKTDLFLYIVKLAEAELESQIHSVLSMGKGFFETVGMILSLIDEYSKTDKALVRLYYEMTSIGQSSLVETVVSTLEKVAGSEYKTIIKKAQDRGEIRADVDPAVVAFILDNIFMSLQFSYAMPYYQLRKRLFVGEDIDDKKIIQETMSILRNALSSEVKKYTK
ncbi:MAG: TetR/AcrR family transcriptional regulator [Christensenellales bacterium]